MELLECLDWLEIGVLFSVCLSVRVKSRLNLVSGSKLVWAIDCLSSEGDWMDAHGLGANRFK